MRKIVILGSTGSIGTQALNIIRENPDKFKAVALSCGKNIDLLNKQIEEFHPEIICVEKEADGIFLKRQFPRLDVLYGKKGLKQLAGQSNCQLILNALVGMRGLEPTLEAIYSGKDIALANKETMVTGGAIVTEAAEKNNVRIIPVDSEHSAIFQALKGNEGQDINRIILTASGGPFRGYSLAQLKDVTLEEALRHPNWSMGSKITVDSATMMNKGLEVIEAKWLFHIAAEKIEVLVHKESIIHSMVEFSDRSIIAQLGLPDMTIPISYSFAYPDRLKNYSEGVDFLKLGKLHFEPVDRKVFRCLGLACEALEHGGSYPVALNAANEVLVQRFLEGRISFIDIQIIIEKILNEHSPIYNMDIEGILSVDEGIRKRLQLWG